MAASGGHGRDPAHLGPERVARGFRTENGRMASCLILHGRFGNFGSEGFSVIREPAMLPVGDCNQTGNGQGGTERDTQEKPEVRG